jgi:hypothetical protein
MGGTSLARKTQKLGDCYQAAANYIVEHGVIGGNTSLRLVHAEVQGQGPLAGTTFGHAWVLDGNTVIDKSNGGNVRMPKSVYYGVGRVDEIGNHYEYTPQEAAKWMVKTQIYGPWQLRTRSGL